MVPLMKTNSSDGLQRSDGASHGCSAWLPAALYPVANYPATRGVISWLLGSGSGNWVYLSWSLRVELPTGDWMGDKVPTACPIVMT